MVLIRLGAAKSICKAFSRNTNNGTALGNRYFIHLVLDLVLESVYFPFSYQISAF